MVQSIGVDLSVSFEPYKEHSGTMPQILPWVVSVIFVRVEKVIRSEERIRNPRDRLRTEIRSGRRKIRSQVPLMSRCQSRARHQWIETEDAVPADTAVIVVSLDGN